MEKEGLLEKIGKYLLAINIAYFSFQVCRGFFSYYDDYLNKKYGENEKVEYEKQSLEDKLKKDFKRYTIFDEYFLKKAEENVNSKCLEILTDIKLARKNLEKNNSLYLINEVKERDSVFGKLIEALIIVESGGKNNSKSKKNAVGLTQLTEPVLKKYGYKIDHAYNPKISIDVCEKEMRRLMENYSSVSLALIAYNWGESRLNNLIKKYKADEIIEKIPKSVQAYVIKILSRYYLLD